MFFPVFFFFLMSNHVPSQPTSKIAKKYTLQGYIENAKTKCIAICKKYESIVGYMFPEPSVSSLESSSAHSFSDHSFTENANSPPSKQTLFQAISSLVTFERFYSAFSLLKRFFELVITPAFDHISKYNQHDSSQSTFINHIKNPHFQSLLSRGKIHKSVFLTPEQSQEFKVHFFPVKSYCVMDFSIHWCNIIEENTAFLSFIIRNLGTNG